MTEVQRRREIVMRNKKSKIIQIIASVLALAMLLAFIPEKKAQAATKEKSVTVQLYGYETKVLKFKSKIKTIRRYGDSKYATVDKISDNQIRVTGKVSGRRYFEVVTADNKMTKCYSKVTSTYYAKTRVRRVVKSQRRIEYVGSTNESVAKVELGKNQKEYLIATTSRKGTAKIVIYYSDGERKVLALSTAGHTHKWVTVSDRTKSIPIYKTKEYSIAFYVWPDGSNAFYLADGGQKLQWCLLHCLRCMGPDAPDPDPQGRCAWKIGEGICPQERRVKVGTKYVRVTSHTECSLCGARR
mgnify:CR=1 FL=1